MDTMKITSRTNPPNPAFTLSDVSAGATCHNPPLCRHNPWQEKSKWTGMMLAGCSSVGSTHFNISARALFLIFLMFILVQTATSCGQKCNYHVCVKKYNRFHDRLNFPPDETPKTPGPTFIKHCRSLKRYRRCLQATGTRCFGCLPFHGTLQISKTKFRRDCYNIRKARRRVSTVLSTTPAYNNTTTPSTKLPKTVETMRPTDNEGSACTYSRRSNFKQCGMFGDPHLRTFDDGFFTCKVNGTWPLINNNYMVVMATNVPVKHGSSATATVKITVIIKDAGKCAGRRTYSATSKSLPRAFTDGSTNTGSVNIREMREGKHVEIHARFIATTVVIRKMGRFLTFAIQMPEEFVHGIGSEPRTQLCVVGCSSSEKISASQSLDTMKINVKEEDVGSTPAPPQGENELENGFEFMYPPERITPGTNRKFTELEARKKCKEIILAVTGAAHPPLLDRVRTSGHPPKVGNSMSSLSFSSLIPDSTSGDKVPIKSSDGGNPMKRRRRGEKKRRGKNRRQIRSSSKDSAPCLSKNNPSNFYFDSCVFDLVTTGDVNFTLAARAALEDVRRMHRMKDNAPGASLEVVKLWEPIEPSETRECPTANPPTSTSVDGTGAARRVATTTWALALCVVVSFVINYTSCLLTSSHTVSPRAGRESPGFRRVAAT